jgi:cell division protein FtsN
MLTARQMKSNASQRRTTMKKLVITMILTIVCAVAAATIAPQAKAITIGTLNTNPCPPDQPYYHVNVFGNGYCSLYP